MEGGEALQQRGAAFQVTQALVLVEIAVIASFNSGEKCQKDNKVFLTFSKTLASWIPNKQKTFLPIKNVEATWFFWLF